MGLVIINFADRESSHNTPDIIVELDETIKIKKAIFANCNAWMALKLSVASSASLSINLGRVNFSLLSKSIGRAKI